jgi:hypothetical protein
MRRVLTRREGLMAIALAGPVALLAGCTSSEEAVVAEGSGSPAEVDPSSSVAGAEAALVARYEAALAATSGEAPAVRALLAEIADQHRAHLSALGGAAAADEQAGTPVTLTSLIADLVEAERSAARDRIRACVDASDPELARVLALIAASEASHVPALRDLRGAGGAA